MRKTRKKKKKEKSYKITDFKSLIDNAKAVVDIILKRKLKKASTPEVEARLKQAASSLEGRLSNDSLTKSPAIEGIPTRNEIRDLLIKSSKKLKEAAK